ncbi:MAG: 50S ribosomal protein L29 [Gammaproteobacteria bacterium]|nr:50S ribosomal protein L29 [Gammaproteobacteria bacterium]|tara:strand:+ start:239 stop:442 length:204 start_codon:yes stop_codon:yes gene_type:complete
MISSDLIESSEKELQEKIDQLSKELFELRMQKSIGQLGQSHMLKQVKKEIARVKTLINRRKKEEVAS